MTKLTAYGVRLAAMFKKVLAIKVVVDTRDPKTLQMCMWML
jgi:hypothetical protein